MEPENFDNLKYVHLWRLKCCISSESLTDLLSCRPVHGLIFLFKWQPGEEPAGSIVQDSRLDQIFFAKQVCLCCHCGKKKYTLIFDIRCILIQKWKYPNFHREPENSWSVELVLKWWIYLLFLVWIVSFQVINNACATQAIVSVLLNCSHSDMSLGDTLTEFREFSQSFDAAVSSRPLYPSKNTTLPFIN